MSIKSLSKQDLEQFAQTLYREYTALQFFPHLPWSKVAVSVQQEFRRYALAILARTGRTAPVSKEDGL